MMMGVHLRGGVGGLLFAVIGGSEESSDIPAILAKSSIGIGRCGRGATILGGNCSNGMPSGSPV